MGQRRHHYEQAFEAYLRERRAPYLSVDEARKALLPAPARPGGDAQTPAVAALKSFDYVVYGRRANLLLDVKGRRVPARAGGLRSGGRLESWVTLDDIRSLAAWERLFGEGFEAGFVFVYWCDAQPPDALFQEVFERRGRWYALRSVRLAAYRDHMKPRSASWSTVDVPTRDFERISRPFFPPGLAPADALGGVG